jgi:hypothetical protein
MGASKQHALLVITTIAAGHREALEKLFSRMVDEQDVETNQWVPFASLTTIHFARWFILPASTDVKGHPIPDQLVFSTNYDGSLDDHLAELVDVAGVSGLDAIYQHCVGYPSRPTRDDRLAYLRAHRANYSAFYVGTVGRTVAQIRRENELRDAIQDFLDAQGGWDARAPADVRKAIQDFVFVTNKERFGWAQAPPAPRLTPWVRFIKTSFLWIVIVLIALLGLLLVLGVIPFWGFLDFLGLLLMLFVLFLVVLRVKEERDPQVTLGYSCPDVQDLIAREDLIVQNQLSAINNMKPGWFRLFTERVVQAVINFAARYFANEGNLGGIPSIHFARWAIIDNGRRLLFMSNFDGSWENYLGDFVDKAAAGLTAVWSNTVLQKKEDGFPETKWLFREGGARDEQRFKAYARASQVVTNVWYSAYKELSVQNINNNSAIRAGLYGDLSPEEIVAWLHRF